ncbi:LptF/LptG family permease [Candidatus Pelagibacter sp.]|nr:LptF/LptG family permease [Candidatus Pelagibacter sp.]
MIKTFELHLIILFLKKILNIFLVFFFLIFILNLFEEISFFKNQDVNLFFSILMSMLSVPSTLFEIFPFIFIIATQFFFLEIISKNELELLKINGLSNIKILRTLFLTSFLIGFILLTAFYALSSKLNFIYFDVKNSYSNDNKYLAVIKESGLWIKDEIDNKILIITSEKIMNNILTNVSIHEFDSDFNLIKVIESDKVNISNFEWVIANPIISSNNKTIKQKEELMMNTHFDENKIKSLFSNLSSLSLFKLIKLKKDYKSLGYSVREIETHLHKVYSLPLFVSLMTVLTSILMFNNKRNTSKIFHLLAGISISVVFYYFNYLFNLLGQNGKFPIMFSIYLPFVILTLIAAIGMVKLNEK